MRLLLPLAFLLFFFFIFKKNIIILLYYINEFCKKKSSTFLIRATRSSSEKSVSFSGLWSTATVICSKIFNPRVTISTCPFVIGSNDPGKIARFSPYAFITHHPSDYPLFWNLSAPSLSAEVLISDSIQPWMALWSLWPEGQHILISGSCLLSPQTLKIR